MRAVLVVAVDRVCVYYFVEVVMNNLPMEVKTNTIVGLCNIISLVVNFNNC